MLESMMLESQGTRRNDAPRPSQRFNGSKASGGNVRPKGLPARRAVAGTLHTVTSVVDETAGVVRGVGDTTAATLGATLRLTGGAARGLGQAIQSLGEAQVVKQGPLAAPSRVFAGVYRIAGAVLTGAGNATIGIGGTVEGVTSEAARVMEDAVKMLGEPTRSLGSRLGIESPRQVPGTSQQPAGKSLRATPEQRSFPSTGKRPLLIRPRSHSLSERLARRLLREAFGSPSERTVALAPPLVVALLSAWFLGRYSRRSSDSLEMRMSSNNSPEVTSLRESSRPGLLRFRRVCRRRPGIWIWCHGACLAIVGMVVLSVDQEQQRRARIMEQGLGGFGSGAEESVRWLNMAMSAVWSPLHTASGLGAEMATYATAALAPTDDVALSISFENVTFGQSAPVLDAVRAPREAAADALLKALNAARATRPSWGGPETKVVMLEADLLWVADPGFEVFVTASAKSSVRKTLFPQLRVRLGDLVFGPVAVAVAVEAAPQGYPYVGLLALTFISVPTIDFSVTPDSLLGGAVSALPLLREALVAGITSALPVLSNGEAVLVYDLGEYLAPGLWPQPPSQDAQGETEGRGIEQHHREKWRRRNWRPWPFRPKRDELDQNRLNETEVPAKKDALSAVGSSIKRALSDLAAKIAEMDEKLSGR